MIVGRSCGRGRRSVLGVGEHSDEIAGVVATGDEFAIGVDRQVLHGRGQGASHVSAGSMAVAAPYIAASTAPVGMSMRSVVGEGRRSGVRTTAPSSPCPSMGHAPVIARPATGPQGE